MGLSGSGKSTAIRTVNQLHSVTAGSVWVDDVDIQTLSGRALQAVRREKWEWYSSTLRCSRTETSLTTWHMASRYKGR